MRTRLIKAGLWQDEEQGAPEREITSAWRIMARLGYPGRFGGKTPHGQYEYFIIDPANGGLLTTGIGESLEAAICEAALSAQKLKLLCQSYYPNRPVQGETE